ncbi:MAG: DUF6106 family protein [Blautia sp.]|nr:DUF6106 family protein [Lachnoclostridium sp.]MCM1210349.1 DUF6106 family protein [Blautia sp.]
MEDEIIMVSETYVECLVARKSSFGMRFLKTLLIMLTVCFVVIGIIFVPAFLVAIAVGVGAYFSYMHADIEYEYLYVDKEISVDRIMAKSKRKKVASYELERLELMAPLNSHHLDAYRNRTMKTVDYSSGMDNGQNRRYVMIFDSNMKVIWEPNEEIIKAMQMVAPRKIVTD